MRAEWRSPSVIALVAREDPAALREWRDANAIFQEGAQFSKAYKKGWTDGKYRFGYRLQAAPPTLFMYAGLRERIEAEVGVEIPRLPPKLPRFEPGSLDGLRDYQEQSLREMALRHWGRIALATNAGKGAIMGIFARAGANSGLRTLILCDEIAVYEALQDQVREWGELEPALVGAGYQGPPPSAEVTIAMQPSLRGKCASAHQGVWKRWLAEVDILLIDEADRALGDSWRKIYTWAENTHWRVAFSGTFAKDPNTIRHMEEEEFFGPILVDVGNTELVERGISARPEVHLYGFDHTLPQRPPEWYAKRGEPGHMAGGAKRKWVYEHTVWGSAARMDLIESLCGDEWINVVIVRSIAHGEAVAAYLDAPFLSGSTSAKERSEVLDQVADGEVTRLVTTSILDRGTNRLGMATNLIFASGEGSTSQTLQRVGRGLRRTGGKDYVRVSDIIDKGHPYLDRQSRKRVRLYADQSFDTVVARG